MRDTTSIRAAALGYVCALTYGCCAQPAVSERAKSTAESEQSSSQSSPAQASGTQPKQAQPGVVQHGSAGGEHSGPKPNTEQALKEQGAMLEAALEAARDAGQGCGGFSEFGPAAADLRGPVPTNSCGPSVAHVRCLETPAGYYVPVSLTREGCAWHLWFVPKSGERKPAMSSELHEEFDLAYTVDMFAEDFTGHGLVEALVIQGASHPEGVSDGTNAVRYFPNGGASPTSFDTLLDVDADGLLDARLDHEVQIDDVCALATDPWARLQRSGPSLVLHRRADRSFTFNDDVARAQRAKSCKNSAGPIITRSADGRINENETARKALCQAADGRPMVPMQAQLEAACPLERDLKLDCPKPRRKVCDLKQYLPSWLSRIAHVADAPP